MRRFYSFSLIIISSFILFACNSPAPLIADEAAYVESIREWQVQRLERLRDKDSWLSLAGLYWLEQGENSFGSDSANDIVFPEKADAFGGILILKDNLVTIRVAEGVEIYLGDSLVSEMELADDHSENTTRLQQGDLAWYIVKRGERYGIRLRDHKHPRIHELDHIPTYPVRTDYVVEATLEAFDTPRIMTVPTPLEGYTEDYECPGILKFRIGERIWSFIPLLRETGISW